MNSAVKTWRDFEAEAPDMAAEGKRLLYQFGLGLGFLATVRADGAPRIHPFCPIVAEGGLWGFIIRSPKRGDLLRDGRFAIHTFPPENVDDEFSVAGTARHETGAEVVAAVRAAYKAPIQGDEEMLFEFRLERALLATYETRPQWPPVYRLWPSPQVPS